MKNHKRFCAIMLNYERFCPITLNYERFWLSALNHKWFCVYNAKPYKMFCWTVMNPTGSVLWMRKFEGFRRSMLNHKKLSIRLYRTKKVLSANAEPCRVLPINAELYKIFCWRILNRKGSVSQCWTIESCLFRYTKSRKFCPRMLHRSRFSVRLY